MYMCFYAPTKFSEMDFHLIVHLMYYEVYTNDVML